MGILHVKLSQVRFQETGRRLFRLQGGGLPPDTQDPKTKTHTERRLNSSQSESQHLL